MFKIIKSSIYDKFHCTMSDCPSNCCDENWNIIIDQATYDRLCSMGVEDIDSKVTKEVPHLLIKSNNKCPFITEEGLCTIHKNYGEDYLSETCRSYPRFASEYGDIFTQTLGISCPEVARMFTELNCNIVFKSEYYYENKSEKGKKFAPLESELELKKIFSEFVGKADVFRAFAALEEKYGRDDIFEKDCNIIIASLMAILGEKGKSLAIARYNNDSLREKAKEIADKYPYFLVNLCRYYFFERVMQQEAFAEKDYVGVIKKAKLFLIISLYQLDKDNMVDSLYKIMRLIDHSESVIDGVRALIGC